jgi:hypothetical protein
VSRKNCLFLFVFVLFLVTIMKQFCVMKKGLKDCLWFFSKAWCNLYILVLRIVSRNFFLFLFFFLTYILLLRSLNNFVSLKGIKGFFIVLLYLVLLETLRALESCWFGVQNLSIGIVFFAGVLLLLKAWIFLSKYHAQLITSWMGGEEVQSSSCMWNLQ